MKKIIFLYLLILLFTSCSESKPELITYTFDKIGWEVQAPNNWEVISYTKLDANMARGVKALGEKQSIESQKIEYLLNVKLTKSNFFNSYIAPFNQNVYDLKLVLELGIESMDKMHKEREIDATLSDISQVKVGGLDFYTYSVQVKNTKGELVLTQYSYSRIINEYLLQVVIGHNNPKSKEALLGAWKTSIFTD